VMSALITLLGVSVLIFVAIRLMPGSYEDIILGPLASAEERQLLPDSARRLLSALRKGTALRDDFDPTPSREAREVVEFLAQESRTRRFLEDGWKGQRAAHGEAVRLLEEMIRTKDDYIGVLHRRLGEPTA